MIRNRLLLSLALVASSLTTLSLKADSFNDIYRDTIISNVTLSVPSDYATINDAIAVLDDKRIAEGVVVTIQVADGTYSLSENILIDHSNSSRLRIIGNETTPSSCTLNFTGGSSGFTINTGIELINGFKIQGSLSQGIGVLVTKGSTASLGAQIEIDGFKDGIFANSNSTIYCSGVKVSNCQADAIKAVESSYIFAISSIVEGSNRGFFANTGSAISAGSSTSRNNTTGFFAVHGAYIEAGSVTVSGNTTNYTPAAGSLTPFYGAFIGQ